MMVAMYDGEKERAKEHNITTRHKDVGYTFENPVSPDGNILQIPLTGARANRKSYILTSRKKTTVYDPLRLIKSWLSE